MNIATTNGEKSIDQLAARLGGSDAAFRERLVEANPHLADVGNLPPGTAVIVPDTTLPPVPSTRVEGAYQLARQTLDDTQAEIEGALQRESDDAAAGREILQSDLVKSAAAKNQDLAKQRQETLDHIDESESDRKAFSAGLASAIASFNAGLAVPGRRRAVNPPVTLPAGETPPPAAPVDEKHAETPTPAPPAKDGGPVTTAPGRRRAVNPPVTPPAGETPPTAAPVEEKHAETPIPAPSAKDGGQATTLPVEDPPRLRQTADEGAAVEAPAEESQPKTAAATKPRKKSVKR